MRLLLCSLADQASVNIRDAVLEHDGWTETGQFQGAPVLTREDDILATIPGEHLHADDVDKAVSDACGVELESVVFLSRHKAASGIPTLSVHPIGNLSRADYGGRPQTLVPSLPDMMTSALRDLKRNAAGLDFQVSFEATHHGPHLETPTMFIEIGSSAANWGHKDAARAIARTLMEPHLIESPRAIGVGGGHYAPRFSEVAAARRVSFGHIMPSHFTDGADDDTLRRMLSMALQRSGDARLVYVHKKSMPGARATHLRELVKEVGAEPIDSSSLESL